MPSTSTKEKIRSSALKLFNENGLVNVRLQHIADEAFVSVGNLAYHYRNMEAIVSALYEELARRQKEVLAEYRILPLFDNMNHLFRQAFALQREYIFFYQDNLEVGRAYPDIAVAHRELIELQIMQLRQMIDFNVSRGALNPEARPGLFDQLAVQIWMTIDLWPVRQRLRSQPLDDETLFLNAVWALLAPYFTHVGGLEYEQMVRW